MTDQRISLARLTAGGMLVLAAFGASAQDMPRNANPFQRPQATSTTPAFPAVAERAPGASEPLTLPPPIPVPADGSLSLMKLPRQGAAPPTPVLPPPIPAAPDTEETAPAPKTAAAAPSAAPAAPAKPRAFLSREKIEANRARCQVDFKGRTLVQLPAGETEQVVRMTGAEGCLTALSADQDWLDVQYAGNNELLVSVLANADVTSRRGDVTVVTPNRTFVLTVRQAGAEPPKPAPVPAALETKSAKPVEPTPRAVLPVEPAAPSASTKAAVAEPATAKTSPAEQAKPAPAAPVKPVVAETATAVVADASKPTVPVAAAAAKAALPVSEPPKAEAAAPGPTAPAKVEAVAAVAVPVQPSPAAAPADHYDAAQARLADVGDKPLEAGHPRLSLLTRAAEPSVSLVAVEAPVMPAMTFALPEVTVEVTPLRSLALLAEKESPVPLLTAADLGRRPVPVMALPVVAAPAPVAPVVPAVTEKVAPVADETAPAPADPARAQSVLRAFQQSAPAPVASEAHKAAAPKAVPRTTAVTKAALAAAKAVAVPEGYMTLDDYDTAAPAKKAGR
jgi:hypothetical protein